MLSDVDLVELFVISSFPTIFKLEYLYFKTHIESDTFDNIYRTGGANVLGVRLPFW